MTTRTEAQDAMRERLVREILAIDARAGEIARALDDRQLGWRPPAGGWSIGEVLEHLCIADEGYLERIRRIAADPRARRALPGAGWAPSLMGGWLARALAGPRRLPAPPSFRPGPRPRPAVLDEFLARQAELVALLAATAELDWRRNRTTSPVSPLLRINLGDCFEILVVHAARHLGQLARVRAEPAFPGAPAGAETSPRGGA
jgi:hypothetical protein